MRVHSIPTDYEESLFIHIDNRWGIINYGYDNAYPQRTKSILEASPVGVACRNKMIKFIYGKGFEEERLNNVMINQRQTAGQLLRILARDYTNHANFAIHVNYNLNYQISSIQRIDPVYCRFGTPDSWGYIPKIAVWNDWEGSRKDLIDRQTPEHLDVFNPDPEIVRMQIERAGGIQHYKGQILYYTGDVQEYVKTHYDPVLNALRVDAEVTNGDLRNMTRGFMAKQVLFFKDPIESEEEVNAINASLKRLQGTKGNDIVWFDGVGENGVELKPVNHNYTDKEYVNTEQRNRMKIYRTFGQPAILHSDYRAGAMGGATEHEDAYKIYNQETIEYRQVFTDTFEALNKYMSRPLSAAGNFEIIPLDFNSNPSTDAGNIHNSTE